MDFPGNSNSAKAPSQEAPPVKKVVESVVTTPVIQQKKSIASRFRSIFFDGQIKTASRYIFSDVVLPSVKNLIVDATSKGVERVIYGDRAPRRGYSHEAGRPRVSYNQMSRYPGYPSGILPDQPPRPLMQSRRTYEVSDIILASKEEAELVLERLNDIVDQYNVASVADLHDLVGLPTVHTDNKRGWMSLAYSSVKQVRQGFLIDLPPAEDIQ